MKGTLAVVIVAIALVALVPTAAMATSSSSASSAYESGFSHGVHDGKDSCTHPDGCHWYILQPGKGFAFHSKEFNRGYVDGFCSVAPGRGSDADEATFSCPNK